MQCPKLHKNVGVKGVSSKVLLEIFQINAATRDFKLKFQIVQVALRRISDNSQTFT